MSIVFKELGVLLNLTDPEDAFDEQVKKDMEKTRDPNAPSSPPKNQQMAPTEGMSAPPRTSQEEQRQIS
ncbi:hypothetical protein D9613_011721 [Agrocybe pediades]|uniref:Uncharacterized protein n=1 Tax=Agrocybe pediades TaxID=84607 RepID=A0A8H4VJ22_9AGAR|nr:hypothetical protein D9613_011721 [Agrocybe pediades]